jgi:hypothetical protein
MAARERAFSLPNTRPSTLEVTGALWKTCTMRAFDAATAE